MHLDLLSIPQSGGKMSKRLLFLTFSALVANPKKLLYTVANRARGLLNREKKKKEKRKVQVLLELKTSGATHLQKCVQVACRSLVVKPHEAALGTA